MKKREAKKQALKLAEQELAKVDPNSKDINEKAMAAGIQTQITLASGDDDENTALAKKSNASKYGDTSHVDTLKGLLESYHLEDLYDRMKASGLNLSILVAATQNDIELSFLFLFFFCLAIANLRNCFGCWLESNCEVA